MIKSEKNTETEDLIIGRHQATAEVVLCFFKYYK